MTVPMGNAADNHQILMQPPELLDLFPMLAEVVEQATRDGVSVQPGNNVGYYGPYERLLRNTGNVNGEFIWQGCKAGTHAIGIESDGAIKGCPSLPTSAYTGGNIRERDLRDIVLNTPELTMNKGQGTPEGMEHLWGFCKTCDFAALCRGGCSWTAHVFFDRRGNNPYCHHRSLVKAGQGVRERLRPIRAGSGLPFDNGEFEILEEPLHADWNEDDPLHFTWPKIQWPARWDPTTRSQ
jgi:radical SAM protein with 4Fe4S-binding SPASM domain